MKTQREELDERYYSGNAYPSALGELISDELLEEYWQFNILAREESRTNLRHRRHFGERGAHTLRQHSIELKSKRHRLKYRLSLNLVDLRTISVIRGGR